MTDDPKKRSKQDRSRISMEQDHEVRYWTEAFGVSRGELEEAVKSVGDNADRVREHLKGNKQQ